MSHRLRLSRRPSPALVVASIALIVALGGAAYASIPGPDGSIHSCVGSRGTLRVIDSAASCDPSEQALNFSQTGPQGAAGPPGLSQVLTFQGNGSVNVPRKAGTPVGSFDLPEGKWAITLNGGIDIGGSNSVRLSFTGGVKARAAAQVDFRNARGFSWGGDVTCRLALGDGSVTQTAGNGGLIGLLVPAVQKSRVQHAALNLQLVHDVPAGGERGFLACNQPKAQGALGSTPAAVLHDISINAVRVDQVGALNFATMK
jgi:hypothetical protein